MSIFKCNGIILKKSSLNENQNLITILSYEYGKININYKNTKDQKSLDIWFEISFETNVKNEKKINTLNNVVIKSQFDYLKSDYETILEYLETIYLVQRLCPLNLSLNWIYEIISTINKSVLNKEKLVFSQLKIMSTLWLLNTEHNDLTIKKILNFIDKNSIFDILKLKWLSLEQYNLLKWIIKQKLT